jgi:hypothetical protein
MKKVLKALLVTIVAAAGAAAAFFKIKGSRQSNS